MIRGRMSLSRSALSTAALRHTILIEGKKIIDNHVSASKVEEVTQHRTELTEIRMEFTTEIMKLRTEVTDLRTENVKLRTEVTDLRIENTYLGVKINELQTDIKVRLYWYPN